MSAPERSSPFGAAFTAGHHGAAREGVGLRAVACDVAEIAIAPGDEAAFQAAFRGSHGLELPPIGRWASNDGLSAFAFQPCQWQIMAEASEPGVLLVELRNAIPATASIVETGHGLAMLELSGPRARDALAKICRLDLHPRTFVPGHCARTIMAQIPVQLWQIDETPTYGLAVPITFAHSFLHALTAAAAEFGCTIHDKD